MENKIELFSSMKSITVTMDDKEYLMTENYNINSDTSETVITDEDGNIVSEDIYDKVISVYNELRHTL